MLNLYMEYDTVTEKVTKKYMTGASVSADNPTVTATVYCCGRVADLPGVPLSSRPSARPAHSFATVQLDKVWHLLDVFDETATTTTTTTTIAVLGVKRRLLLYTYTLATYFERVYLGLKLK